eukprot:TRINITY_DN39029_c0_g1_i1.p1 TRINITY_DN39029_c0_g1~~TRINITY_DN39029_c0_g1_i1.p1  ORF type:complete len:434 (+),score=66.14 TRINITY_DN39029_c0_g1_i1:67-1368(+)
MANFTAVDEEEEELQQGLLAAESAKVDGDGHRGEHAGLRNVLAVTRTTIELAVKDSANAEAEEQMDKPQKVLFADLAEDDGDGHGGEEAGSGVVSAATKTDDAAPSAVKAEAEEQMAAETRRAGPANIRTDFSDEEAGNAHTLLLSCHGRQRPSLQSSCSPTPKRKFSSTSSCQTTYITSPGLTPAGTRSQSIQADSPCQKFSDCAVSEVANCNDAEAQDRNIVWDPGKFEGRLQRATCDLRFKRDLYAYCAVHYKTLHDTLLISSLVMTTAATVIGACWPSTQQPLVHKCVLCTMTAVATLLTAIDKAKKFGPKMEIFESNAQQVDGLIARLTQAWLYDLRDTARVQRIEKALTEVENVMTSIRASCPAVSQPLLMQFHDQEEVSICRIEASRNRRNSPIAQGNSNSSSGAQQVTEERRNAEGSAMAFFLAC